MGTYQFGVGPQNRVYWSRAPQGAPSWQQTQNLIRNGQITQARSLIDQRLQQNKSLRGAMDAVWALEQAGAPNSMLTPYRNQAYELARTQARQGTTTPLPWIAIAKFSLEDQNDRAFRQATQTLVDRFPNQKETYYFHGIQQLKDKNWAEAEREFRKAREMGMPEESLAHLLKMAIDNQKWIWEYAYITLYAVGAWVAGLVLLFIVGKLLSRWTLRWIRRSDPGRVSRGQRLARRVYRLVINVAGLYYFVSLPIVVLLAIALPLSIGYALLILPGVSLYLAAIVLVLGFGGLVTALTGIRACFVRVTDETPGRALSPEQAPDLWQLAREVAEKVGTRPVDEVYLTPATELGVFERGGFVRKMRDRGRRVLLLGIANLDGFRQDAFRSVLAHEHGHFLHRDTAGGDIALRVNLAMVNFAEAVGRRGKIHWWDVGVQFLRLYHFLFSRLTFGACRLQEVHADRVAAQSYGPAAFKEGLLHAVRRTVEFDHRMSRTLYDRVRNAPATVSFYQAAPRPELHEVEQIESVIQELIHRKSTADDTHPSPAERFALVDGLEAADPPPSGGLVWDLFQDRDQLVAQMNDELGRLLEGQVRGIQQVNRAVIRDLSRLLDRFPDPVVFMRRAELYFDQGEYENALKDLNEAFQREPKSGGILLARAQVHKMLGNYGSAAKDLLAVLDRSPLSRDFDTYYLLGLCCHELKQYEQAARAFSAAMDGTKPSFAALLARGRSYRAAGDTEKATRDFTEAIDLCPRCPEAYLDRAETLQSGGDEDRALADLRRAVELAPQLHEAHRRLAWLLATSPDDARRNGPEALEQARLACSLGGADDGRLLDTLAAAHAEMGDFNQACQAAEQALSLLPQQDQAGCRARLQMYRQEQPYRRPRSLPSEAKSA